MLTEQSSLSANSVQTQGGLLDFLGRIVQTLRLALHGGRENSLGPIHSDIEAPPLYTHRWCLPKEEDDEVPRFVVETIGDHPIALGGYSDVWKGHLKREEATYSLVAVKVLRQFGDNSKSCRFRKNLKREARIWKLLDHESIAVFHGVVYNSDGAPAMISPWYTNGSADLYLQNHPNVNPLKLIKETVMGVEYLHNLDIVHGDLKGANVMVDDVGHAKLIDFGLSRLDTVVGITGFTMSMVSFSIRWCAPELVLVDTAQVTKATDVYACASTALQLLTGDVPYSTQREITVLRTVLDKIPPQRPSVRSRYPIINEDALWDLLGKCWSEPFQRPTISELKAGLHAFYP